jgi:hypothetical protein
VIQVPRPASALTSRCTHQPAEGMLFTCKLKTGAFVFLDDGRVLDNRFDQVIGYGQVGCN